MQEKNTYSHQETEKKYIDLFYMTPLEVSAKELADLFQNTAEVVVQLWEEMNVLELELPSDSSIDFEPMEASFTNPADSTFIKYRNIKTIFAINLCESDLQNSIPYFEKLVASFSGFVCTDSPDFKPVYAGSTKRVNNEESTNG